MTVGLISCVKTKRDRRCRAEEMYVSDLFKKAWAYAKRYDERYILSAKYGLLKPGDVIEPYELTLNRMPAKDREHWAMKTLLQINQHVKAGSTLYFHAGERYREGLLPFLVDYHCAVPLKGVSFGNQLKWYAAQETKTQSSLL